MNIERNWDGPRRVLLTIDDYELLDRSGAFREYGRTELIEGVIVAMNAQFRPHARAKMHLVRSFLTALSGRNDGIEVFSGVSVGIPPKAMPEPDIVLTVEPNGDGAIPVASVKLLVEISNSTLPFDLREKATLYAAADVPEYWVVDIEGRKVTVHSAPLRDAFRCKREVPFGDMLVSDTIVGLAIPTDGLH